MKHYDVIVVGSGSGMLIVDEALSHGLSVALVDRGPLGGTCLNVGCIPSKMLIYPADRIVETQQAAKLGITAEISSIDFKAIVERTKNSIAESQKHMREGISQTDGLDFYKGEGHFVGDYTLEVDGNEIEADTVFLASGSRPLIPPMKGLDAASYITNENVLDLESAPGSLVVIGGGYIGVEYGHFFAAMGSRVVILEMADRLVLAEEPEVSHVLQEELGKRVEIRTNAAVEEVRTSASGVEVVVRDVKSGETEGLAGEKLMVAVGRRSNADLLTVENTGVEVDTRGFVKVDEYLETSKKGIFGVGDANGRHMFTHVANREALVAAHNAFHDRDLKMDYSAIPHAVYSYPQIASVGLTEEQARENHSVLVGKARYSDVAKGEAMMEESGFAKAIVDSDGKTILGFHIVGPFAPILIQEVVNAMASGGHMDCIRAGLHIHPALSELIQSALAGLEEV
ncbi:MAG: dihydrolipoyl dehydrogenase [Chloroflexota bacterium]|nr:dihydrolipoyl dehydrogenase [Chloroflexota bacterium]